MEEKKELTADNGIRPVPAAGEKKKRKKRGRKKVLKRIVWTVLFLLVIGVVGWSVYSKLRADYRVTYDPYTATTGSISNSLSFTGNVQLENSTTYTAASDCKVREVYVAVGDRVKEGDKLMRLSDGSMPEAEFDATVSTIDVKKDDEVKAGDSLMTVADFDHMEVSVRVGESDISQVHVGQTCRVAVPSAEAAFESTIDSIDYVAYTGNNVAYYTTVVKIDGSAQENLWPGRQATVTVPLEEAENVTVLKLEALSTARDNTAFVYKETSAGEMEEVPVTVGVSNGNYVEIKSGVTAGETVYKIVEKEEGPTGLAGLFSGMFSNRQVNQPGRTNRNWQNQNGYPGGGAYPGGGTNPGGSGGGGTRNSTPGGSRGN